MTHKVLLVLAAMPLLFSGCERDTAATAPQAAKPALQVPQMPKAEADFIALANGKDSTAFCDAFARTPGFEDWPAKVTGNDISTVNGSVDITFSIGGKVKLEEVVQKSDPLYETLSALRLDDRVRMTGRFAHGNGECTYGDDFAVTVTKLSH
ncbi:MAG: hypothetical protein ACXU8U_04995 [Asticcacaulis sp.]